MPRSSRKNAAKFRNRYTVKPRAEAAAPASDVKPKAAAALPAYDATKYLKGDLKWTGITTAIVIIVLIILYIVFH